MPGLRAAGRGAAAAVVFAAGAAGAGAPSAASTVGTDEWSKTGWYNVPARARRLRRRRLPRPAGRPCTAGSRRPTASASERNGRRFFDSMCRPVQQVGQHTMFVEAQPIRRSPRFAAASIAVGVEALGGQDRPLVLRAAQRVLADRAVRPDDPVARHDQRDRVVAERRADGADRLRPADLGGDPAVRPDLAARDVEGLAPDVLLELAVAAQVEVDAHAPVAGEPALDRAARARSGSASGRERRAAGPGRVAARRTSRRLAPPLHAAAVPGHVQRPDRRVEAGDAVGQADLDEDVRGAAWRARSRSGRPRPPPGSRHRCERWSCGHLLALEAIARLERGAQQGQAPMDLGLDGALGPAEGGGELGIGRPSTWRSTTAAR